MKNIQIIDDADNATYSIFQATDEEFAAIFPGAGQDMETSQSLSRRLSKTRWMEVVEPIWSRPILKRDAMGIHGTLYYVSPQRRKHIPRTKREVDTNPRGINQAQRDLFDSKR